MSLSDCICPDENIRLDNCPRHGLFHQVISPKPRIQELEAQLTIANELLARARDWIRDEIEPPKDDPQGWELLARLDTHLESKP